MPIALTDYEIPRRKTPSGGEGGPLIIPPGAVHQPGDKMCKSCKRKVKAQAKSPYRQSCKCLYYRRTTTFIDVMQDEYLLKQWGNRNVAWGMAHRPDLVLQATSCKRPSEIESGSEDYRDLNAIVAEAQREAGDKIKATIGTSLHKLTHMADRGETLGYVPDPYPADLAAYDKEIKRLGIEWVSIESFRVLDDWVLPISECDHKAAQYGGNCTCFGVAGTVDRIGWYKGRLRIFDIKTGSDFNKLGHAMQLAMYAHMVPYQFPGDVRGTDPDEVDLSVGHIIYLPERQGACRVEDMDLELGWRACQTAKNVWEARDWNVVLERDTAGELTEMAGRATSLKECRSLWINARDMGRLDQRAKVVLNARVAQLKSAGVTK